MYLVIKSRHAMRHVLLVCKLEGRKEIIQFSHKMKSAASKNANLQTKRSMFACVYLSIALQRKILRQITLQSCIDSPVCQHPPNKHQLLHNHACCISIDFIYTKTLIH